MISEQQKPVDSGFGAKSEPNEVLEGIDLSGKVAMANPASSAALVTFSINEVVFIAVEVWLDVTLGFTLLFVLEVKFIELATWVSVVDGAPTVTPANALEVINNVKMLKFNNFFIFII